MSIVERLRQVDPFVNDPVSLKPLKRNPDGEEAASLIEELVGALEMMTEHYARLANSGDAGFWDPEDETEVRKARTIIAKAKS